LCVLSLYLPVLVDLRGTVLLLPLIRRHPAADKPADQGASADGRMD
jgi:hypothetical protein